jgi:hypothetical protein
MILLNSCEEPDGGNQDGCPKQDAQSQSKFILHFQHNKDSQNFIVLWGCRVLRYWIRKQDLQIIDQWMIEKSMFQRK